MMNHLFFASQVTDATAKDRQIGLFRVPKGKARAPNLAVIIHKKSMRDE